MKKKILLFTIIAVVSVMVLGVLLTGCYYEDKTKSGIDQIKEGGKLVIATSANFPPFENLEKGKIVGWDIDVAQALADELGAPGEVIKLESGTLALQRVKDGQADAVILDKLPAEEIVNNLNAQGGAQLKILADSVYDDAYAFAIGEGNTELKEWIDATFKKLQDNGTISELNEKWFGGSAK